MTRQPLPTRIVELALRLQRRARQESLVHGLTPARLAVLRRLNDAGPRPLGELAAAEGVTPATMSRVVDALQEGKLVVRSRSREDRRLVEVIPTALGRSLVAGSERMRVTWLAVLLDRLPVHDRSVVEQALAVLEELMAAEDGQDHSVS